MYEQSPTTKEEDIEQAGASGDVLVDDAAVTIEEAGRAPSVAEALRERAQLELLAADNLEGALNPEEAGDPLEEYRAKFVRPMREKLRDTPQDQKTVTVEFVNPKTGKPDTLQLTPEAAIVYYAELALRENAPSTLLDETPEEARASTIHDAIIDLRDNARQRVLEADAQERGETYRWTSPGMTEADAAREDREVEYRAASSN